MDGNSSPRWCGLPGGRAFAECSEVLNVSRKRFRTNDIERSPAVKIVDSLDWWRSTAFPSIRFFVFNVTAFQRWNPLVARVNVSISV